MNAELCKQQAEAFLDYASKSSDKDLTSLFNEWAFSKDFSYVDKSHIWKIVRRNWVSSPILVKENSDEFVRVDVVLKILFEADVKRLEKLVENREKKQELIHNTV